MNLMKKLWIVDGEAVRRPKYIVDSKIYLINVFVFKVSNQCDWFLKFKK